jgi:hypothetical protein
MTRPILLVAAIVLLETSTRHAIAYYNCKDGQMPAPPEVAAQMALPLCGFAATKRWGPNGCQLCDARNVYPNPFSAADGERHWHRHRALQ